VRRRASLAAAAASSIVAIALAVSGGFMASVGGVRVSARSPRAAGVAAALLALAWLVSSARADAIGSDLAWLSSWIERRSRMLLVTLALLTGVVAAGFATRSPSGADASGYLSQAAMWAGGEWRVVDGLTADRLWPLRPDQTAPLGWRPALEPGWQVPTYAPGLPLLMAVPFAIAGNAGASAVITLSAALAVFATGALARRLAGGRAGLQAASLLAGSPTFLYQSLQPMSDVPITALWISAFWALALDWYGAAGAATALAVLVRPNLAPLAAIPLLWLAWTAPRERRAASVLRYACPVAIAAVAVAAVQWRWYGSPLLSGYGAAADLFTLSNVVPNARLYGAWMWQAEPAFVLTGAVAAATALVMRVWPAPDRTHTPAATLVAAIGPTIAALSVFACGVVAAYLVYAVFERWPYVRFLLPAIAAAAVLCAVAVDRVIDRVAPAVSGLLAAVVVVAIVAGGVTVARRLEVFEVADVTARAVEAGVELRRLLPPNAVLIAGEQSGSMRHETGRPIVRWETLDVAALRTVLGTLDQRGLEAWWVLDQWEESIVRGRFPDVPEAALDWPPRAEGGPLMRTRAWRIADLRNQSRR
jgi:hypothetical protein